MKKTLEPELKAELEKIAGAIRSLSIDAVQAANSGHPGLPLGCAELGSYLYGMQLRHNPKNPDWLGRDRFILSAGHGSAWLYSCLHLAGFNLSLDQIKNFRQLDSQTPGHPEKLDTEGVETTTGPLGQGVGNAVGQALGLKLLAAQFNTDKHALIDNKVYCLAGDGCIMEGISAEACSLAGHLCLNNLVLIYDSNDITLDGPMSESCSENTQKRFEAYDWNVVEVNGNDLDALHGVFSALEEQKKPTLIIAKTIIGKGSPGKAGTHKVHGSPLGEEEVAATKKALKLPSKAFFVDKSIYAYFEGKIEKDAARESEWKKLYTAWAVENQIKAERFAAMQEKRLPENLAEKLSAIKMASPIAGRKASQAVLEKLADILPFIYGGSADLSCSDSTMIKEFGVVTPDDFSGRNIKYGVREFAMATIATGMEQTGMIVPFIGTFLTFTDYMRNAIRLASLQKSHVIYQMTHDSVFLGEDGPTHQPVEHYAALRAIPNLQFIRPADAHEVRGAWMAALNYQGPTVIALTRQNLPTFEETKAEEVTRGAYILKDAEGRLDFTLMATGSEVSLAMEVAKGLEKKGKKVRVISMPCWELFEAQDDSYKKALLSGNLGQRVSIESGVSQGWHKYIGIDGIAISIETFGKSAPANDVANVFGFTSEAILEKLL